MADIPAAARLEAALDRRRCATPLAAPRPARIAIAFSGGADSTALLHVGSRTAPTRARRGRRIPRPSRARGGCGHVARAGARTGRRVRRRLRCRTGRADRGMGASIEAEAAGRCAMPRSFACATSRLRRADDRAPRGRPGRDRALNLARGAGIGGLAATARSRSLDDVMLMRPLHRRAGVACCASTSMHASLPSSTIRPTRTGASRATRSATRSCRRCAASCRPSRRGSRRPRCMPRRCRGCSTRSATRTCRRGSASDDELDVEHLAALSERARRERAARVARATRPARAVAAALREMLAPAAARLARRADRAAARTADAAALSRPRVDRAGGPPRAGFVALTWRGEDRRSTSRLARQPALHAHVRSRLRCACVAPRSARHCANGTAVNGCACGPTVRAAR